MCPMPSSSKMTGCLLRNNESRTPAHSLGRVSFVHKNHNQMAKAMIVKNKAGETIAACLEPQCYTDKEWLKDLAKYTEQGYKSELLSEGVKPDFSKKQRNLF
jgi:hypothetical protein